MTPDELALVRRSFEAASADGDRLARAFYDHLWSMAPEVRSMFPEEMEAQRQKLLDELAAIVEAVSDLGALVARTTPLAQRHVEYGVEPDHYELVGEALAEAMAEVLGDAWDEAAESAWRYAYDLVAETMLRAGYTSGQG